MQMLQAGATLVQIGSEFIYGGGVSLRNMQLGLDELLAKAETEANPISESDTVSKN
jgi:dihydroorotate dehydrogenase